jgi:hypothetical protein
MMKQLTRAARLHSARTIALVLCMAALAGAALPALASGPAGATPAGEAQGPALRAAYAALRAAELVPPRARSPEREAALSYITAHERRPIYVAPAESWENLWDEAAAGLRRRLGAGAP